jgi:hypothetical protein
MDPGIGTDVAEFGGIRFFADAGRIGDDQEETFKFCFIFSESFRGSQTLPPK